MSQAAVTQRLPKYPEGLYFGGTVSTLSNQMARKELRQHAGNAWRLAWIDLHQGLGSSDLGERTVAFQDDLSALRSLCQSMCLGVTAWLAPWPDGIHPDVQLASLAFCRACAICNRPSKIRLSTSSNGTDRLGAIFQPAPPVMKQRGSVPQCWRRTCCCRLR